MKTRTLLGIGVIIAIHHLSSGRKRRHGNVVRNPQYVGQRLPMRKWL